MEKQLLFSQYYKLVRSIQTIVLKMKSLHLISILYLLEAASSLQASARRPSFPSSPTTTTSSRRAFFASTFSAASLSLAILPQVTHAVAPITEAEASGGMSRIMRPKPPSKDVLRQKLSSDFAILLTRASYVETAQLDIIPINQLERDMYLIRTSEYQPYVKSIESVKQGDLTDPYYFDYMNFVQFSTINRAIADPDNDYEEMQPIMKEGGEPGEQTPEFKSVHVTRTLPDDELVSTYDKRVGAAILSYLDDTFGRTPSGIPKFENRPGNGKVLQALTQLVNLFLICGFAWEGKAELVQEQKGGAARFLLTLQNPATLWTSKCLAKQNAPVRNDFLLKTAKQLVESMGYTVASSSVKIDGNKELSYLTIQ